MIGYDEVSDVHVITSFFTLKSINVELIVEHENWSNDSKSWSNPYHFIH